ncbi:A1pp-domain-containing protein [Syncephalis fuscata]|nr:A1pp-domain-containing protein [Syncephalis fuscata]
MVTMGPATAGVRQLSNIPTLVALYRQGLLSSPAEDPHFRPDRHFLDKISLIQADITTLDVDAIVNAANNMLIGGGGVDGCIHRAAGPGLLRECRTLDGCLTGDAKITAGYQLPAHHVIHTVGPVGEDPEALTSCYFKSLELMKKEQLRTIAFSSISTGVFGYPILPATHVALNTVRQWIQETGNRDLVDRIIFCVFSSRDHNVYLEQIPKYFPPSADIEIGSNE